MKRILLSFCSIIFFVSQLSAQFNLELGFSFNSPTSGFSDVYEIGAGAYLEPGYALNDNLNLGLQIGANGFAGSDIGSTSGKVDATVVVPVLAKGTYSFLDSRVSPYLGFGTGMYFAKVATFSESALGGSERSEENISEFGIAPSFGVNIGRTNLGVAYHSAGDITFLQFILGVKIID
ncbi:hypothetical protein SAMN05421640_2733 [Ekhidna lutea]|uniref:Uncharacterized protein n=1 Tax=Ekhidna lutea TaxID=447679 RepID=A0A239KK29_EKHLU|nr:outer membrane beta-barrel protein [Ekhidna lutea]SNT18726.1 hypothetical protein SAMN05421640_2733 [Ekhidna lutea]